MYGAHVVFNDVVVYCSAVCGYVSCVGVVVKDGGFVYAWRSRLKCECVERMVRVLCFLEEL